MDIKKIIKQSSVIDCNIHIVDSYKVTSIADMRKVLKAFRKAYPGNAVLAHRSDRSLLAEWWLHNLAYKLGVLRSHTRDVDMNYPLMFIEKISYAPVSWFIRKG